MHPDKQLRFFLAILIIGLFTISVYNMLALSGDVKAPAAYREAVIAAFSFVWAMMVWLAHEDPGRFKEIIYVTIVGLSILAVLEAGLLLSGAIGPEQAQTPIGQTVPLVDAMWAEVLVLIILAASLFYLRPQDRQPTAPNE